MRQEKEVKTNIIKRASLLLFSQAAGFTTQALCLRLLAARTYPWTLMPNLLNARLRPMIFLGIVRNDFVSTRHLYHTYDVIWLLLFSHYPIAKNSSWPQSRLHRTGCTKRSSTSGEKNTNITKYKAVRNTS